MTNKEMEEALKAKNAEIADLQKQIRDAGVAPDAKALADAQARIAELEQQAKAEQTSTPVVVQGEDPAVVAIEKLLTGRVEAPTIKVRGNEQKSEDRRTWHEFAPAGFVHMEELNFRTAAGYDDNWKLNAESAIKRGLAHDFGGVDKSGMATYDKLPPFDPRNRVVVIVAVLPALDAVIASEE